MTIQNSELKDLDKIFELYRIATDYMKSKNQVSWPEFERDLIVNEIKENRQWKIVIDGTVACIWATTLNDELIWGKEDGVPSVYLHRIAVHPDFRGQKLVQNIVEWAKAYAKSKQLDSIRMDTVGQNEGLIKHYEKLGFNYLGSIELDSATGLPDHYNHGPVCYFEMRVKD